MNLNFPIIAAATLLTFCVACHQQTEIVDTSYNDLFAMNNVIAESKLTLVQTNTIEIPLDSLSLNYSYYPVYVANDTAEYYVTANEHFNSIDFYDLNRKRLVKRNVYEKSGLEGIQSTRKIYAKSLDSIYVYSAETQKILVTNYDGAVLEKYPTSGGMFWMASIIQPLTIIGHHAYFGLHSYGDSRAQKTSALITHDIVNEDYRQVGPRYPEVITHNLYFNFIPFYTFGHNNNIVTQFGALSTLYNYDMKKDSTTMFQMKSQWQEKPIMPDVTAKEFNDLNEDFELIEQDAYMGVYFDRYHDLYYSIFQKGIPLKESNGKNHDFYDKPVSIIIFNKKFEYCGEIRLKENTYYHNFICTKKGLLIPMSHPKNPTNDENKLRFAVFSLEKI
jgi:hypothetical protein